MARIVLISILLTLVYSWEELKQAVRVLFYRLLRQKRPTRYYTLHLDQFVGTLVLLATIPISLAYFLASQENFLAKLGWLALSLLVISLAAAGSGIFLRRLQYLKAYEGFNKIVPLTFSVAGFVSPFFQLFNSSAILPRNVLAKFAFFLSLPPLAGLFLKHLVNSSSPQAFLPHQDILIYILVVALFMRLVIEFLERYFRLYRLEKLFSYFRVILGIILAVLILVR